MGGFFGTISTKCCVNDLFYGTDYNSHLGTRRAGLVTYDNEKGFSRKIHNLERDYFRSKFEDELDSFSGNQGIGVISDTDPQPILVNSHLGRYAVVTVAKITNIDEIAKELLERRMHFSEYSANTINQTELVALLINMGRSFVEGINLVYRKIEGSCSMLILTEKGIIAARDFLGRTPVVIGKKEGAYAVSSETTSFPNLEYHRVRDLGPGEIVLLTSDKMEVLQEPFKREQICSFLWVYYGFPASDYNGINVEAVREANGKKMGEADDACRDAKYAYDRIMGMVKDKTMSDFAIGMGTLTHNPRVKERMIKKLSSQGYNAMADEAGMGTITRGSGSKEATREAVEPLIVFDRASSLQERKTRKVDMRSPNARDRIYKGYRNYQRTMRRLGNRDPV